MPTITNVRIMRFRKVQPEKFGGAGAEVELNATIHEDEDYRDITRGLLFDARAMCYENLGMRLPKEAFDSDAELAELSGEPAAAAAEDDIPGEPAKAETKKPRGRPAGSKNTAPKKGSKAWKEAQAKAAEAAAAPGEDEIPGEEKPKDQISTGEERVDPDAIPGEDAEDAASSKAEAEAEQVAAEGEEEMDGVGFNSYINDSIRASKLTGLQAKLMMKEMSVARVRDLNTPEKLAQAKMMIDAFIDSNEAQKG